MTLGVPDGATADVAVFDALGRRMATLHEGTAAGELALDAAALAQGVYVVRAVVRTEGVTKVRARSLTVAR